STINSSLSGGTNVILQTTASSASGPGTISSGPGDIIIAASLTWSSTATLTLDAYHGVTIRNPIHLKGKGTLNILTDDGGAHGALMFTSNGGVTFDNLAAKLKIDGNKYTLVSDIDTLASDISDNASGFFALARDYDAAPDGIYTTPPVPTTFT